MATMQQRSGDFPCNRVGRPPAAAGTVRGVEQPAGTVGCVSVKQVITYVDLEGQAAKEAKAKRFREAIEPTRPKRSSGSLPASSILPSTG